MGRESTTTSIGSSFVLALAGGHLAPFTVETMHTIGSAGELITASNSEYAFHRPLPDGRVLRVERDYQPIELGAEEHRQWEAYRRHFGDLVPATRGVEEEFDRIPRVKPAFRRIWSDAEGRLWIHRYKEAVYRPVPEDVRRERGDRPVLDWREPTVYDLFAPDGSYLAEITLPPRTGFRAASGRHIWAQQAGEFGEVYIVHFRIEAPNAP